MHRKRRGSLAGAAVEVARTSLSYAWLPFRALAGGRLGLEKSLHERAKFRTGTLGEGRGQNFSSYKNYHYHRSLHGTAPEISTRWQSNHPPPQITRLPPCGRTLVTCSEIKSRVHFVTCCRQVLFGSRRRKIQFQDPVAKRANGIRRVVSTTEEFRRASVMNTYTWLRVLPSPANTCGLGIHFAHRKGKPHHQTKTCQPQGASLYPFYSCKLHFHPVFSAVRTEGRRFIMPDCYHQRTWKKSSTDRSTDSPCSDPGGKFDPTSVP
ncbi:xanthine dehydrogenase [Anopheles sinensis]|uniref:Xanthine dehydrogenase n=1 Tax=Anopheles sinensis TaxID=74873 RepID=A0A084VR80_ANOSI|nr:xanthine dehydrogenase [Anopheles sinensis]